MPVLPPGVYADFPPAEQLTPLFRQYTAIKAQHPGALLLYRLGDFYEMFGHDAVRAAELLGLTLTARHAVKDYKVAMCGVPHHSSVRYIKRLVQAGETVALCEQTQDPAEAKGLVERAVTRVITAGTLVEDEYLAADSSNFLAVLAVASTGRSTPRRAGLAVLESSGGRVELSEVELGATSHQSVGQWQTLLAEATLRRYPAEVLAPAELASDRAFAARLSEASSLVRPALHTYHTTPTPTEARDFVLRHFQLAALEPLGLDPASPALLALYALLRYLRETFRAGSLQLYPQFVSPDGQLQLDPGTVKHLELFSSTEEETSFGGLYGSLNQCSTAAGRRLLKQWMLAPTADLAQLQKRQNAVELLFHSKSFTTDLADGLSGLADLERVCQRISLRRSNPKELRALVSSLPQLNHLAELLRSSPAPLLEQLGVALGGHAALHSALDGSLAEEPPVQASDGGVIRPGIDAALDDLRQLHTGGSAWFARYEELLREQTGIRTLKVKQTGPFGWFIEISKAQDALVPREWERRQTLVNNERFTTPELREREAAAGSAQSRLQARERELLEGLYAQVEAAAARLARSAWAAAQLDVLVGLATLAREQGWCKTHLGKAAGGGPEDSQKSGFRSAESADRQSSAQALDASSLADAGRRTPDSSPSIRVELEAARHPLVEAAVGEQYYTANDCYLSADSQQVMLLTGPNMGGKSSYLRMIAVLAIINQLVGFVPAKRAVLPLFDRIFTRIGAHDALSRGQSTFMVEMLETARILRHCTPASLLILDEVGRGTSTYDGISIAKAVLEHLHEHPARPLTLFATHFFELTDLALLLPRLANFQVEVARGAGETPAAASGSVAGPAADHAGRPAEGPTTERLVFTYRVVPGAASDSFGIEVARQAGLPESVVQRAEAILRELEDAKRAALAKARHAIQLGLFGQ